MIYICKVVLGSCLRVSVEERDNHSEKVREHKEATQILWDEKNLAMQYYL